MDISRKISLSAGILYLLTFVSIPTLALYGQVKSTNYILGTGPDTPAIIGGILEIIVALAGIGTAVVLFRVLKKQNETLAIGLIASRVLEAGTIFMGVAFILAIVVLRQSEVGKTGLIAGQVLSILYSRIFLLGQSFLPAINDLLLGVLLYQSRLVPKPLALIGIIGAIPLIAGFLAVFFGVIEPQSSLAGLAAIMVALFELSLGLWLAIKGFSTSAAAKLLR